MLPCFNQHRSKCAAPTGLRPKGPTLGGSKRVNTAELGKRGEALERPMGLFSTIAKAQEEDSKHKSLQIPTLVQLHTTTALIKLDPSIKTPSYATLSYQAISAGDLAVEEQVENEEPKGLRDSITETPQTAPDLGIFNCRIKPNLTGESSLSDSLLQSISPPAHCFAFCVDLSDLSQVETSITLQQEALVRYLIAQQHDSKSHDSPGVPREKLRTETTSLYKLRSVQFGLAPDDDTFTKSVPNDEGDRDVFVALYITATMPETPLAEEDIRGKQLLSLVTYHLRRYADQLDASLSFVGGTNKSTLPDEEHLLPSTQIAVYWREFATGNEIWKDSEYSSRVYGPGNHDTELVDSVLLRNATYPGHWDASKDSIWKIVSSAQSSDYPQEKKKGAVGDEHWLKELRDSVGSAETLKTPPPKKQEQHPEKTPNDAATAAFFESLLK